MEESNRDGGTEDLIVVARVARARGLRGEVVADVYTDFPERFENIDGVIAIAPDGSHRSLQIEEHWFQGHRIVFKFADYDSIDAAKELAGYQLAVPTGERVELLQDQFYEWELAGCRVEGIDRNLFGTVGEVMHTGGVELLLVANDAGRELLVPKAWKICLAMDFRMRLFDVNPSE